MWLALLDYNLSGIKSLCADTVIELGLRVNLIIPFELVEELCLLQIRARVCDQFYRLVYDDDRDTKYFDVLSNG